MALDATRLRDAIKAALDARFGALAGADNTNRQGFASDLATAIVNEFQTNYLRISRLDFSAGGFTTSVGTEFFLYPWFITSTAGSVERWIPVTRAGKLRRLRVIAAVGPSGGSVTFTVRVKAAGGGTGAGADTDLRATLGVGATLVVNNADEIAVAEGDEISIKVVENAGYSGGLARVQAVVEYEPD